MKQQTTAFSAEKHGTASVNIITFLKAALQALILILILHFSSAASFAHIDLKQAGTHVSRYEQGAGGRDTKIGPCGNPAGVATGATYTYKPGETITINIAEYIPHPGYFRIAFDNDGDDDFMNPRWIVPVDSSRKCPINEGDQCRTGDHMTDGDFYNNETVLMDNLNPHTRATAEKTYTWEVTLPNVECGNCTLQIIQVMEDRPYTMNNNNSIYFQCIDIKLVR